MRRCQKQQMQPVRENERKQEHQNLLITNENIWKRIDLLVNVFLYVAKEDLGMRQAMVQALAESVDHSNQALDKISYYIASVGKSIGDGLALLAQALARHMPPKPSPATYNYAAQPNFGQTTPVLPIK